MFIFAVLVKFAARAHPENFVTCEFSHDCKISAKFRNSLQNFVFCEISHCNSASSTVIGLLCTVHYFVLYDIYFIIIIINIYI